MRIGACGGKKEKIRQGGSAVFLVSAGTGLIGIGTFTLLSKLNPFVQDAGIAFDLWLFFPRCFRWF